MQKPLIKKKIMTAAGPQNIEVYTPLINHCSCSVVSKLAVSGG
jgi:hypothetical protein